MAATDIERAAIWEDCDATCMARVTLAGVNITQSDIASVTRRIFDLSSATPTTAIDTTPLTVSTVVFDTLQTDARWTKDATGYNFRDHIAGSEFPDADHLYRVEYMFTGAAGEKFVAVYELPTRPIYSDGS